MTTDATNRSMRVSRTNGKPFANSGATNVAVVEEVVDEETESVVVLTDEVELWSRLMFVVEEAIVGEKEILELLLELLVELIVELVELIVTFEGATHSTVYVTAA